jgi:hypothetical protein
MSVVRIVFTYCLIYIRQQVYVLEEIELFLSPLVIGQLSLCLTLLDELQLRWWRCGGGVAVRAGVL